MPKRQRIFHASRVFSLLAIVILSLGGCAPVAAVKSPRPSAGTAEPIPVSEDKAWRQIAVSFRWPEQNSPSWYLDTLLAHQVFRVIILEHGDRIGLWRFHRRAVRDKVGHRFRFLFYADGATAALVNAEVERSVVLQWMLEEGSATALDQAGTGPASPDFASSSDPSWPESIQRSWPFFIYGVSQNWLDLVHQVSIEQSLPDGLAGNQLLERFRLIDDRVSQLWRVEGQHAYLHHLNAVFAYQPLEIRESTLKRF